MLGVVGWQIEIHELAPKAARLPRAEGDAERHPNRAHDFRRRAQIEPEKQADGEPGQRQDEVCHGALLFSHEIMDERREVHAHERDERAEVEELSSEIVTSRLLE